MPDSPIPIPRGRRLVTRKEQVAANDGFYKITLKHAWRWSGSSWIKGPFNFFFMDCTYCIPKHILY